MASLNEVNLIGNLGNDPEVRTLDSGVQVATFSIATTKTWKDKNGEKHENTQWHYIVAWRGLAEVAGKFLNKGKQVFIQGELQTRDYEGKDGTKRYVTEVVANQMLMLGKAPNSRMDGLEKEAQKREAEAALEKQAKEPEYPEGWDREEPVDTQTR